MKTWLAFFLRYWLDSSSFTDTCQSTGLYVLNRAGACDKGYSEPSIVLFVGLNVYGPGMSRWESFLCDVPRLTQEAVWTYYHWSLVSALLASGLLLMDKLLSCHSYHVIGTSSLTLRDRSYRLTSDCWLCISEGNSEVTEVSSRLFV